MEGKLIYLLLILVYYAYTAITRHQKKKAEEARKRGVEPETLPAEEVQRTKTLQEVLRKLGDEAKREEKRKKPVPQKKEVVPPQKQPVPLTNTMTSRLVENVKETTHNTAYDTPTFEHIDSSKIQPNYTEIPQQAFDLRQAFVNTVILERPEY